MVQIGPDKARPLSKSYGPRKMFWKATLVAQEDHMRRAWSIVTLFLLLAPCLADGQSKTDPTLNKLAVAFEAAYNAHDAAKVAAFYADDAVLMVPAQPLIRGRSNIENYYESIFGNRAGRLHLTPIESAITTKSSPAVSASSGRNSRRLLRTSSMPLQPLRMSASSRFGVRRSR